jgi:NitT/TauT family transport system ATP-binding protein
MIEVDRITFKYPEEEVSVFENFSWSISQDRYAVLGPSGCGKTSLLYLLAGLYLPGNGEIRVNGEKITRPRPGTGLILQDYGLLPWSDVRTNVSLGLEIRRFYGPDGKHAPRVDERKRQLPEKVDFWLDKLGLGQFADKYPSQLSGGQRQRVAIARTLVLEPDVLLMDEPFSSLDAPTRESLQELTMNLCEEQGITLLLVTHTIEEAVFIGHQVLLLDEPPNRFARVIDNPHAGSDNYRHAPEFQKLTQDLRSRMGSK